RAERAGCGAPPRDSQKEREGRIERQKVDSALPGRSREEEEDRGRGEEKPSQRTRLVLGQAARREERSGEKERPGNEPDRQAVEIVVPGLLVVPRGHVTGHVLPEEDLAHVLRPAGEGDRDEPEGERPEVADERRAERGRGQRPERARWQSSRRARAPDRATVTRDVDTSVVQ